MRAEPSPSVERVREELRRLGYLDTGLDRFVLGGAASTTPLSACARVALRVGVAGGALFGSAFTGAAALLDAVRARDLGDVFVLLLYVTTLAAAVLFLLAFLAGATVAWLGRRIDHRPGPTFSRNVGFVAGALGSAYLGLWWWSHARVAPLLIQLLLGLLLLGLVLALTRFGSLAAVAVLSAGGVADRLPEARNARYHMARLVAATVVLFAVSVWLASQADGGADTAPEYAVRPRGLTVRVLGIDGFDTVLALQMAARGEMPQLARRMAESARARLSPEPEQVPAIVWTTIATGRGPQAHGIHATGARRLAGMKTPLSLQTEGRLASAIAAATDLLRITRTEAPSAVLRSAKAFWNVASDKGLRVGIVNWWATWPAEEVNGYVVSDRTFFKVERGEPFDREVHPPDAGALARESLPSAQDRARRLDLFYVGVAGRLRPHMKPDVEALYLPGLDIFTSQQMSGPRQDLAALDARLSVIRDYYRFLDRLIADFFGPPAPGEVQVLIGDPGRLERRSTVGLLLVTGGPARPGDLGTASERDVAPTLLHLTGLPVSREMEGRVLVDAFTAEFQKAHPVEHVPHYGRRRQAPAASGFDREMIEELRSLGYIQ